MKINCELELLLIINNKIIIKNYIDKIFDLYKESSNNSPRILFMIINYIWLYRIGSKQLQKCIIFNTKFDKQIFQSVYTYNNLNFYCILFYFIVKLLGDNGITKICNKFKFISNLKSLDISCLLY